MIMAGHEAVAQCCERPSFADWPCMHSNVAHATTPDGCDEYNREIAEASGISDRLALSGTGEYNKTRVRCFAPGYGQWFNAEATEFDAEFAEVEWEPRRALR